MNCYNGKLKLHLVEARVLRSRDMKRSIVVLWKLTLMEDGIDLLHHTCQHLPDALASVQEHSEYALTFDQRERSQHFVSFLPPDSNKLQEWRWWQQLGLVVQKLPSPLLTCFWLCSCVMLEWLNNPAKAHNTFLCRLIQWPCPFLWAVTHFKCSLCFDAVIKCHMWWRWCSLFHTWFASMPRCWRPDRWTSDAGVVEESESHLVTMHKNWPPLAFFRFQSNHTFRWMNLSVWINIDTVLCAFEIFGSVFTVVL